MWYLQGYLVASRWLFYPRFIFYTGLLPTTNRTFHDLLRQHRHAVPPVPHQIARVEEPHRHGPDDALVLARGGARRKRRRLLPPPRRGAGRTDPVRRHRCRPPLGQERSEGAV